MKIRPLDSSRLKFATGALMLAALVPITPNFGQESIDRDPGLRQAEAEANRLVEHFHQSLDFKEVFADEFVRDPKLRARAFSLDDENKWKSFDTPTRERVYVTMMTFLHLWAEYMMIQKEHDVPPELAKQNSEPKLISNSNLPQTLAELNQDLSELEQSSAVYRKYFPAGVFLSAQYRESITKSAEYAKTYRHNVPRIENGNARFGIPESVPVYVVRPEAFDYYFIEEQGRMKLFYINILPNMRLF